MNQSFERPDKNLSEMKTPPPTPTLGTRVAMFTILALIVAGPFLWMSGSGPLMKALSPWVCPDGTRLFLRSDYEYDQATGRDVNNINFGCAGNGKVVESKADIILFSACAGPFLAFMLFGLTSSFFRNRKNKTGAPEHRRKS